MNQDAVLYLLKESLLTLTLISAPVLLPILLIGVLVSILQVVTQVQEMTLTFIPKLVVTVAALLMMGDWMLARLKQFATYIILQAVTL